MLEADSQYGKGSGTAKVDEERAARICRITRVFYVHLRFNVCTEIVAALEN